MNLPRIKAVLLKLTSGVTSLQEIYALSCFKKGDGSLVSWKVFRRGIRNLEKDKYIKIINLNGVSNGAYGREAAILIKGGIDFLCTLVDADPDDFRVTIPKNANLEHELKLTEIVNTIKQGWWDNLYFVETISDETQIRKGYKKLVGKKMKGVYLADLETSISARRTDQSVVKVTFRVEFDNGHKGRSYWSPKLGSWHQDIIVITRDARRSRRVANYIKNTRLNICILTLEEFKQLGLLGCASALLGGDKYIYDSDAGEWKKIP